MWKTIWNRFMNLFKAKTLSVLDAAENPIVMYELAVQESELNIQNLTKAIAMALADQKSREGECNQAKLEVDSWLNKAKTALAQNSDSLASAALERKAIAERKMSEYAALNEHLATKIEDQRKQLERFKVKHEELKAKKSVFAARYQTAKAQKNLAESMGGLNQSAVAGVSKLEEKINRMESESEALLELTSGQNTLNDSLEDLSMQQKVKEEMEQLSKLIEKDKDLKTKQQRNKIAEEFKHLNNEQNPKKESLDAFYEQNKTLPKSNNDSIQSFFKQ